MKNLVPVVQAIFIIFVVYATAVASANIAVNATEPALTSDDFIASSFYSPAATLLAYDSRGSYKAQFGPHAHDTAGWCLDADSHEHSIYYGGSQGIYRANIDTGAHEFFHAAPPGFAAVRIGLNGGVFVGAYQSAVFQVTRFDRSGNQTHATVMPVGSSIRNFDISDDECIVAYTTTTNELFRYDICHGTILGTLAVPVGAVPLTPKYAPNGDLLVAMNTIVARYDPAGNLRRTYGAPASITQFEQITFPNASEFFAGNRTLVRINADTGAITGVVTVDTAGYLVNVISVAEAIGPPQPVPMASHLALAVLAMLLAVCGILATRR